MTTNHPGTVPAPIPDDRRRPDLDGWTPLVFLAGAGAMLLMVLTLPVDHDEGQYVAAALATARGLKPYADYVYLQTPLQPLLTAPITRLVSFWIRTSSA